MPVPMAIQGGASVSLSLASCGFPRPVRHLALEVFTRGFFADPRSFSAGELLGMCHLRLLGSAEGLLFDAATT